MDKTAKQLPQAALECSAFSEAVAREFLNAQRAQARPVHQVVQSLADKHFPDPDDESQEATDLRFWVEAFGFDPVQFWLMGNVCYCAVWLRGEYPRWAALQLELYAFLYEHVGTVH